MIYDVNGNEITSAYSADGSTLTQAYDVQGNPLMSEQPDIPVTPLTWNMTTAYKTQVLDALNYIDSYKRSHALSYAFCQFNDVHTNVSGNEPNFIDYNKGYKSLSRMLFLGDIANRETIAELNSSVAYIEGAQASKRLVGMGNHEYWNHGNTLNPEQYYIPLTNATAVWMNNEACIFYSDDDINNVRYIVLNYFWYKKSPSDSDHYIDEAQLEWLASVMESAGSKDIIIAAHSMFNPFTKVFTGATISSSADTTQIKNAVVPIISAFKNRSQCTVTVDGVSHVHSFASCTGRFILYTSGHYHTFGFTDADGFNMFTCVARGGAGWNGSGDEAGFTFYLIDRNSHTIEVIICFTNSSSYQTHYTGYTF